MEHYDASGQTPASNQRDLLIRMQAEDADQRLLALFDEIDEMIEEGRERDREHGLDPGVASLLDAISGDEHAPLEFRSLHRRVGDGALTWEQFWLAPEEEAGGHRLINAAMKAAGSQLDDVLRQLDEDD